MLGELVELKIRKEYKRKLLKKKKRERKLLTIFKVQIIKSYKILEKPK